MKLSSGSSVNVKVENVKRLDEPTAEMPAVEVAQSRAPVVMRMPGEIPSRAVVEAHNLAHLPSAPWCEICIAAKGSMYQRKHRAEEKLIPQVQCDYFYMSATGKLCDEQQAKACLLSRSTSSRATSRCSRW